MSDHAASFAGRGGWWVVVQALLMAAAAGLGVLCRGARTGTAVSVAGAALMLAGGAVALAGTVVLGRNRTAYPRPRDGSELVRRGVYGRIRHPLYTGILLAAFGWATLRASVPALATALALAAFFNAKARHEERWLRVRFPEYEAYARRVPRFLPRLRTPAP